MGVEFLLCENFSLTSPPPRLALHNKLRAAIKEWGRCPISSKRLVIKPIKCAYQREIRRSLQTILLYTSKSLTRVPSINKLESFNKKCNDISSIRLQDGCVTFEPSKNLPTFAHTFIPSPPLGLPITLDSDSNPQLPSPSSFPSITSDELQFSFFFMSRNSTPGHDGLTLKHVQS